MLKKISPLNRLIILLLSALVLTGFRTTTHKEMRTFSSIEQFSLKSITQMTIETMQLMGYQLKDWNDSTGYVYGSRSLISKRRRFAVNVITGYQGQKFIQAQCFTDSDLFGVGNRKEVQEFFRLFNKIANRLSREVSKEKSLAVKPSIPQADSSTYKPAVKSGKSVMNGQLFVEAEPKDFRVRILNIKPKFSQGIRLKPGRYLLEVSAFGYNTWKDWIELAAGEKKTVKISLSGEHPMSAKDLPKIWLFSVGISDFTDESLELRYAATDAKNFYKFFRSASGAMLPKTQAVLLIDEAASRANVIRLLVRFVKQANEKDLIVIFFATHGLPDPDTGEINFIMYDTAMDNLVGSGLSHSDLDRIIQRSRASKVLFIVDACHSGGLGVNSLLARRGIRISEVNRLISKLAEATDGTAVLSASSSNEMSMEGERWGGGVFTYYMIGGLRGRADANQDQIVTLRELFDYVYKKVPAATDGQQHPELKGQFSNDLPLVEVNP